MQDTAGEAEMNSKEMYSYGSPHLAVQKQDDQHERTFSSYVRIREFEDNHLRVKIKVIDFGTSEEK